MRLLRAKNSTLRHIALDSLNYLIYSLAPVSQKLNSTAGAPFVVTLLYGMHPPLFFYLRTVRCLLATCLLGQHEMHGSAKTLRIPREKMIRLPKIG